VIPYVVQERILTASMWWVGWLYGEHGRMYNRSGTG
jgi:hypothetical protein